MKTIERYIFFRLVVIFLITQGVLTGIIWVTQSLRQLDLVSSKGQTILQFFQMTLMVTPFLVMNIVPFAIVIATIIVLNALRSDSELNALSAAGASRMLLFRPFLYFAIIIAIIQFVLAAYVTSEGLKAFRKELVRVRLDLVANIVKPGQFQLIDEGVTFHIKNRMGDGQLQGIVLDDRRDPNKHINYVSAQGHITELSDKTLLILLDGALQRMNPNTGAMSIVQFETYAFDLTSMIPEQTELIFKPSERSLMEIWNTPKDDPYYIENKDHFDRNLVDRLSLPLYIFTYIIIVFAFLGNPATTRHSREISTIETLVCCTVLQILQFAAVNLSSISFAAQVISFVLPVVVFVYALWTILSDVTPRSAIFIATTIDSMINSVLSLMARFTSNRASGVN